MTTVFQIIDGDSEISILKVEGVEAEQALTLFTKARTPEGIEYLLETGRMEILEFKGKTYHNLYI